MVDRLRRNLLIGVPAALMLRPFAGAAQAPLRIEITEGVVEPMPFAAPGFVPDSAAAADLAARITQVVIADLTGTGLFREIPSAAHIGRISNFDAPVAFADWKAINAQALITGAVGTSGDRAQVRFRLWDVFAQQGLGEGLKFEGAAASWRRLAHKVADAVYSRLTGESGYFDSKVAFIAASGPKDARRKQLAIMDYDGANAVMLTDGSALVLTPRLSQSASQVLYTSYERGAPKVMLMQAGGGSRTVIDDTSGMTFAPRFSPDGKRAIFSKSVGTGSDIFVKSLGGRGETQLTRTSSIDTAPCFSPDGNQIVFESDRGGTQQIYVMPASGGEAQRISFGAGRYATPVWSPRGDMIAFTKIDGGRFHIGVMRTDGSGEKLLTGSYLDEGPSWAPNGRVLMFFRESPGSGGGPQLYSVDITGRNLRQVPTAGFASDPSWSGLLS
ncbi:Tol-Pal system beta propeller repeat protein TolB [Amaricoccus sp.]|uniref:Tol-Pal system beta propeller repeat protein TolB n=1 Tax=Amaricoccus sp. TaxID=1872485 RepID=UPI00261FC389|nr:Tol-Pal system beta propeller repeat protein TolB [Amaricoccus sp.]HRO13079.1 Tol-Pal system beta propeller repeat protein TolB [Amaricoccus sp.]